MKLKQLFNKDEIDKLKKQIDDYKGALIKLNGTLDSLNNKINNRSLTEEQWLAIQNFKNEKAEELRSLVEKTLI